MPIEIRERLGLKAGDRVEFFVENGETKVRPFRDRAENPFLKFIGMAPLPEGDDSVSYWRELRGHDRDDKDDY